MNKTLLLCSFLVLMTASAIAQSPGKKSIIAYYTGDEKEIEKYPVDKLTHIIYSFLKLEGNSLAFQNDNQKKVLTSLVGLKKKYPGLKVMVSIGGWGGCEKCSPVFASEENRRQFAKSVAGLLKAYNADGIDLDWEYPAIEGYPGHEWRAEDRPNFTDLVVKLREEMGPRLELSFAAGGFTKFLEQSIEWDKVMPLLDRVNLMTYDLVSGFSKVTGHHTALQASQGQPEATDHCVDYLLRLGVPSEKLVIGAAFYARVWKEVAAVNNGLHQPGIFKTSIDYKKFGQEFGPSSGFVEYWDDQCMAPYRYNKTKKEFATYDNERSITAKSAYVVSKNLGGIMFWELTLDAYRGGLVEVMHRTIQGTMK
ncbi:glycoside hydrolase family 18 protein [Flavihumibacter rivuli]|uniref:glycoside hydrolase family 18 protein n=1 Tax=Flavihumibacter rivuli TaxID=2838156 RepID=UPI001BDDCCE0|nr:glycoside hydrolase family 18 protein [Flavihumibacter rivuli]ULQ56078.1 glycoside hydrolase family 18 protein [Flavihumibacter rivuli]